MDLVIEKKSKNIIELIFNLFTVSLIWIPLNVNPSFIDSPGTLNFYRIISVFLLLFCINYRRLKISFPLFLLLAIQVVTFYSGLLNRGFNYDLYWPLLFCLISIFIYNSNKIKFLFYASILIIFLMALVQSSILISHIVNNFTLLTYSITSYHTEFLGMPMVRATGISRNFGIILIVVCFFIFYKNNFPKLFNIILHVLLFFLSLLILSLSSRGGLLCTLISLLFLFFNFRDQIKKILILFLVIFSSIVVFYTTSFALNKYENYKYEKELAFILSQSNSFSKEELNDKIEGLSAINRENLNQKISRQYDSGVSSGRFDIWLTILTNNNHPFIGGGSLYDKYEFDLNSSNIFIYLFSSSGVIGLIFFCLYLFSIFRLFISKYCIVNVLPFSLILFFLVRMLFENSFAIFGIDFIIFITSYFYSIKESSK